MENEFKADLSVAKHMVGGVTDPPKPERVERTCLNCDRTFLARGRFNRTCSSCRRSNREIDSDWFGTKVHARGASLD
jgi:hypothetical protein